MVWILAPFAAAIISSIIWYEDAERNLTRGRSAAFGVAFWWRGFLVIVVGNMVT
jgi:hypothetical protein